MCKKRSKSGDWVVDQLSFSDAVKAALVDGGAGKMQGTLGYNILLNDEIQAACAITPEFAFTHHTLNDVANDRAAYGSTRSMAATARAAATSPTSIAASSLSV